MGKVYQSVRGMVQGTLNRKRTDMAVPVQPNETGLDDAMDALEKGVVSGLARLKLSVRDDQAGAANKLEQAEQVIAGLRAKAAGLEVQLREAQEALQKNQAASEQMEETLGAEIRDLQSAVKQKEEVLENRDSEIKDLKSQTDVLGMQVADLESAIQETKDAAASEARRSEQVIDGLRAEIGALEARLKETDEALQRSKAAAQKMEETLGAEIRDLQSAVKQKQEALENRDSEIKDLKSQTGVLEKHASDLELAIQQSKEAAANAAERAGQVILDLGAKVAGLEAQLRAAEDITQRKEAASVQMEESLGAEIRDLQSAVKQKEEALEKQDSEINALKAQTDGLAKQVSDLELSIEQTKEAAESEAHRAGQVIQDLRVEIATLQARLRQKEHVFAESDSIKGGGQKQARPVIDLGTELDAPTNGMKEMPSSSSKADASPEFQAQNFQPAGVTPAVTDAVPEIVSRDAFDRLIAEFSECANVIKSMASLIMRHHVRSLGETMEEFPQTRLTELLDSLSREIPNDKLKAGFLKRFGKA